MSKTLVSIGLPVFTGEKYIRQSLDSILGQSYADLELIISDNGSTDAVATHLPGVGQIQSFTLPSGPGQQPSFLLD